MSSYNHNGVGRNHLNNNGSVNNNNSIIIGNGTSNQHNFTNSSLIENDFINHRPTNHTADTSSNVQLTRPTSRTALMIRQRRAMTELISCFICKGYLVDATTIDECMDSFCKSCIVTHLRTHKNCPKCRMYIQKPGVDALRADKTLQSIVYKMVPGLYDNEMRRRRDFYRNILDGFDYTTSDEEEESADGSGPSSSSERYGVISYPKPFYKPSDTINLSIEPQPRGDESKVYYDNSRQSIVTCFTGSLQQRDLNTGPTFTTVDGSSFKTYLKCPGVFTVAQLKKFIVAKFNVCRDDTVRVLYLNEALEDRYSLIDIAYIYPEWRRSELLPLFYIIERDLSKASPVESFDEVDGRSNKSLSRQHSSVGTQATKRVCIEPQPHYYEEKMSNGKELDSPSVSEGRSMRPRYVDAGVGSSNKIIVKPPTTNSIMKTNSAGLPPNGNNRTEPNRSLRSQQPIVKVNLTNSTKPVNPVMNNNDNKLANKNQQIALKPDPKTMHIVQTTNKTGTNLGSSATQSSLVTLASFTQANANHVVTSVTSASTSFQGNASMTSVSPNISKFGTTPSFPSATPMATTTTTESFVAATNSAQPTSLNTPGTPQLAFRIVTKQQGITIMRSCAPINHTAIKDVGSSKGNQVTSSPTIQQSRIHITAGTKNGSPESQTQSKQLSQRPSISPDSANSSRPAIMTTPGSSPNSSSSSSQQLASMSKSPDRTIYVTPRHHIKEKPVYKTFVDLTKLKSPNNKKPGSTARY